MHRDDILDELREVEKDLHAFKEARAILHQRLLELKPPRQDIMTDWPVFKVIDNGLIIAVVKCEGLLEDYRSLLDREGTVLDNVIPLERKS